MIRIGARVPLSCSRRILLKQQHNVLSLLSTLQTSSPLTLLSLPLFVSSSSPPLSSLFSSASLFSSSCANLYWAKNKEINYDDDHIKIWKQHFPHLEPYSDEDLKAWRRVFDAFDLDKDENISQADLQKTTYFTLEKAKMLKKYDTDRNNLIDFGEFVEALYNVDKKMYKDNFEGFDSVDLQLEFDKYAVADPNWKGKMIPPERILSIMRDRKFTCVTECDAKRLFDEMDMDKDGFIDFDDFRQWILTR